MIIDGENYYDPEFGDNIIIETQDQEQENKDNHLVQWDSETDIQYKTLSYTLMRLTLNKRDTLVSTYEANKGKPVTVEDHNEVEFQAVITDFKVVTDRDDDCSFTATFNLVTECLT